MVLLLVWSYYRLPETRGRSFEELDIMFGASTVVMRAHCVAKKVPARQFKHYKVQPVDEFGDIVLKQDVTHHELPAQ